MCLAAALYHEGRDQPLLGQIAIGNVVLHRVQSPKYPNDICGVIKEGGEKRGKCQFSFYCDGKSDEMRNAEARKIAISLSIGLMIGLMPDNVDGAIFYHADYVSPNWPFAEYEITIGNHLFYKEKE